MLVELYQAKNTIDLLSNEVARLVANGGLELFEDQSVQDKIEIGARAVNSAIQQYQELQKSLPKPVTA